MLTHTMPEELELYCVEEIFKFYTDLELPYNLSALCDYSSLEEVLNMTWANLTIPTRKKVSVLTICYHALELMDDVELWNYLTWSNDFVNAHNFRYITLERIIKGIIMLFRHYLHKFRNNVIKYGELVYKPKIQRRRPVTKEEMPAPPPKKRKVAKYGRSVEESERIASVDVQPENVVPVQERRQSNSNIYASGVEDLALPSALPLRQETAYMYSHVIDDGSDASLPAPGPITFEVQAEVHASMEVDQAPDQRETQGSFDVIRKEIPERITEGVAPVERIPSQQQQTISADLDVIHVDIHEEVIQSNLDRHDLTLAEKTAELEQTLPPHATETGAEGNSQHFTEQRKDQPAMVITEPDDESQRTVITGIISACPNNLGEVEEDIFETVRQPRKPTVCRRKTTVEKWIPAEVPRTKTLSQLLKISNYYKYKLPITSVPILLEYFDKDVNLGDIIDADMNAERTTFYEEPVENPGFELKDVVLDRSDHRSRILEHANSIKERPSGKYLIDIECEEDMRRYSTVEDGARRSFRTSFCPEILRGITPPRELEERHIQADLSNIADVTQTSVLAAVRPSISEIQGTDVLNRISVVSTEEETVERRVPFSKSGTENIVTEKPRKISPEQVGNAFTEQLDVVVTDQPRNINGEPASGGSEIASAEQPQGNVDTVHQARETNTNEVPQQKLRRWVKYSPEYILRQIESFRTSENMPLKFNELCRLDRVKKVGAGMTFTALLALQSEGKIRLEQLQPCDPEFLLIYQVVTVDQVSLERCYF